MIPRALPSLLLPALALLPGGGEPEGDPFLAALEGRWGPAAVAAPGFDAEAEAASWTTRPRREIVDGLAALLLRGEGGGRKPAEATGPPADPPPSRISADFDPAGVPVTDRLAAWVPADAAAAFFPSLREAEDLVEGLAGFLPRALPAFCGDGPGERREALRRAVERLLLPTIWGSNPNVRTGTRQVAVVAADPDLRWGADVALVAEVDDASLVEFHRRSSMRWEGRGERVIRVDGLDAVADDGSIRSFFGMRGGVAVWSTTRDLRDRILAAGEGREASLLRPDPRAYALARRTFPAAEGGALLVVPDGFLARADSAGLRAKRAAALRCEAARLLLDARSLAGKGEPAPGFPALACPAGGTLHPVAGNAGSSCSLHGTASDPVPLGDLPAAAAGGARAADPIAAGALPVAARWREGGLEVLVPPLPAGRGILAFLERRFEVGHVDGTRIEQEILRRVDALARAGPADLDVVARIAALTGTGPRSPLERDLRVLPGEPAAWRGMTVIRGVHPLDAPEERAGGGVLTVGVQGDLGFGSGDIGNVETFLLLRWR